MCLRYIKSKKIIFLYFDEGQGNITQHIDCDVKGKSVKSDVRGDAAESGVKENSHVRGSLVTRAPSHTHKSTKLPFTSQPTEFSLTS